MKKSNKPILRDKEIFDQISAATSIPFNTVFTVIAKYHEIIQFCIEHGVEVKIGELGVMGWKVKDPHYGVVYYNIQTGENMDPIDVPGFWVPQFKAKKTWRTKLRAKTEFWDTKDSESEKTEEDE